QVPQLDESGTGGGEHLPVGAEGHASNAAGLARQAEQLLPRVRIPERHVAYESWTIEGPGPHRNGPAVGAEGEADWRRHGSGQVADDPTGRRLPEGQAASALGEHEFARRDEARPVGAEGQAAHGTFKPRQSAEFSAGRRVPEFELSLAVRFGVLIGS